MKISIIVPIYNVEKYLSQCLNSIINQTLKDIEIICVDDCSNDNSAKILDEYSNKDSRIKVYKNDKNMGQGFSRNLGIKKATGDYIGFIDSDDEIPLDYFEYLYDRATKNNADIASARVLYVSKNGIQNGDWLKEGEINGAILTKLNDKIDRVYKNCSTGAWKHIYNRNFIINNNIEFLSGYYHEDQFFNVKAFYYANKIVTEEYCSPCYLYKVNENSTTHKNVKSSKYKKTKFDQFYVIREIINFLKDKNVDEDILSNIYKDFE